MQGTGSAINKPQKNKSLLLKDRLRRLCQERPAHIGFAEAEDARMLTVAKMMLAEQSVSRISLFGVAAKLHDLACAHSIDLAPYADRIVWREPIDGTTNLFAAAQSLAHPADELGLDAVLAGNVAATADVIRAGIKGVGLATGVKTVSGSFIMSRADAEGGKDYLYADCGVVITPTVAQLVDIASESIKTWRGLFPDQPPVVAFLSFSTKGSAAHPDALKMQEAAQLFHKRHPEVEADGELQFDAAFDASIGERKAAGSRVPGRANCFVFPDLGAGNIAYKITQRLAGFEAYGPILQGLAKPFSDLSRGSTIDDILVSAYINLLRR